MHYARFVSAALPLLSFFATGAIALEDKDIGHVGKLGKLGQKWPRGGYAFVTDVVVKGRQEYTVYFSEIDPSVTKLTFTILSTGTSQVQKRPGKGDFAAFTDVNDPLDRQLRLCLDSVLLETPMLNGAKVQNRCLENFTYKFGDDPTGYKLDNLQRYDVPGRPAH